MSKINSSLISNKESLNNIRKGFNLSELGTHINDISNNVIRIERREYLNQLNKKLNFECRYINNTDKYYLISIYHEYLNKIETIKNNLLNIYEQNNITQLFPSQFMFEINNLDELLNNLDTKYCNILNFFINQILEDYNIEDLKHPNQELFKNEFLLINNGKINSIDIKGDSKIIKDNENALQYLYNIILNIKNIKKKLNTINYKKDKTFNYKFYDTTQEEYLFINKIIYYIIL